MKIGGFNVSVKVLVAGGVILAILIGMSAYNKAKEKEEVAARMASIEADRAARAAETTATPESLSWHDRMQLEYQKQYGLPPEGFEWNAQGEPVAISDDSSSCEDVVFMFLRALSMQDYYTAGRYSDDSVIIDELQSAHDAFSKGYTSYYDTFLNKQFTYSVSSLEVDKISNVAVFPDGTQYVTVDIKALDLSSKEFIDKDKDALFESMRKYEETEDDDAKMEQFIYEYLLDCYNSGIVGKKTYTVELVVSKKNQGGWLVSNDRELYAVLQYEHGLNTAQYIKKGYNEWVRDMRLKEQREKFNAQSGG